MNNGDSAAGTPDEHFDLVSVLYHALQGAEEAETYSEDADDAGDDELTAFFAEVAAQHRRLAEQAKSLLKQRLNDQ